MGPPKSLHIVSMSPGLARDTVNRSACVYKADASPLSKRAAASPSSYRAQAHMTGDL